MGGRSGQALQFLAQNGLENIYNGGGFMQLHVALEHYKNNKSEFSYFLYNQRSQIGSAGFVFDERFRFKTLKAFFYFYQILKFRKSASSNSFNNF